MFTQPLNRVAYAWRAFAAFAATSPLGVLEIDMFDLDEAALYEQFIAAREGAILLTDRFTDCPRDDPKREELWDIAMSQTETARLLLEEWLRLSKLNELAASAAATTGTRPQPSKGKWRQKNPGSATSPSRTRKVTDCRHAIAAS